MWLLLIGILLLTPTLIHAESLGLRVITAYNAVREQADDLPCHGALAGINFCTTDLNIIATNELPLGSRVLIEDIEYLVADRTSSKYRYRYDILKKTYKEAIAFGRQTLNVKLIDDYGKDKLQLEAISKGRTNPDCKADRESRTFVQRYLRLAYGWAGLGGVPLANAQSPCEAG